MSPAARERGLDLVVLVSGFPSLSQTFVLHELLGLEERGLRLRVVALRRSGRVVRHDSLGRLRATVEYLPDPLVSPQRVAVRRAHAALAARNPARYLAVLARIRRSPDWISPRLDVTPALGRSSHLGRAALLAHRIVQSGAPALYIHFAHRPTTIGRFAALLAGVPYAFSAHARDIWLTPPDELAAKVRDARTVLTCTAEGRKYLQGFEGCATPVHLTYHGVSTEPVTRPAAPNSTPVILAVGRLVEKKGYPTLLRAAADLQRRGVDFTVRIVGEGPEWPRLQRFAHELAISDRIIFLGPLSESEVRHEYARADVFTLPCQQLANGDRDGIPNTILEAMAHSLPVVSTTLDGVQEAVIDGECGVLVAPRDATALAGALERLLMDPARRRELGSSARGRVIARFDREGNFPAVYNALSEAGIVRTAQEQLGGAVAVPQDLGSPGLEHVCKS